MHIFFYGRVSTLEQQEDGSALQKQLERGKEKGATRFYWDIVSRSTENRPGLQRMLDDLQHFQVEKLLVTRIDRIGSSSKLFYSLLEQLRVRNIKLEAIDQNLDVNSCGGQLTIDILLAASKFEVGMLSSRMKAERSHRRTKRKPNACTAPFGWTNKGDKYAPNTTPCVCLLKTKQELRVCDLAQLALDKFFEYPSSHAIAKYLNELLGCSSRVKSKNISVPNVTETLEGINFSKSKNTSIGKYPKGSLGWTPTGIKNWLVNPIHAGGISRNATGCDGKGYKSFDEWSVDWGTHQGFISREHHEKIKTTIRNNRSNRWSSREMKLVNPYANLLKCVRCKGAIARCSVRAIKNGGYTAYFQCVHYTQSRCDCKTMLRNDKLEQQLKEHLVNKAEAIASRLDLGEELEVPPQITSLRQNLAQLEKCSPNRAIERAKNDIKNQIQSIKRSYLPSSLPQKEDFTQMFHDKIFWNTLSDEEKKRVLGDFVACIWVDSGSVAGIDLVF